MKCDLCNKQAVVHEVTIKNGVSNEVHLCHDHAKAAGMQVQSEAPMAALLGEIAAVTEGHQMRERQTKCAACGLTFSSFRKVGALGCPACYDAFMPMLGDIIERAQAGATAHTGMHPRGSDDSQRVQAVRASLMRDLEAAITAEQYERAASIRDQLTSLDGGNP